MQTLLHCLLHLTLHLIHCEIIVSLLEAEIHLVLVKLLPRDLDLLAYIVSVFTHL